jgi:hypothetical protein
MHCIVRFGPSARAPPGPQAEFRNGREATAALAYLLHLETTSRADRLPGEVEHWRSILP